MRNVSFADVIHPHLRFSPDISAHALILRLIDTPWVQRLRDISQTANTRLVYMFSEHSRFGHSVGVAYLADNVVRALHHSAWNSDIAAEIEEYAPAVTVAALLHDLGHLAPGAHTAFKAWFPDQEDEHENIGAKIVLDEPEIRSLLESFRSGLSSQVAAILREEPQLPPWTWQVLSGGGWNVDRGSWCYVDSVLAGVNYGKYNISALTESLLVLPDRRLAISENRFDAMVHFAVSRHAMYRQIYHHRVLLAADALTTALVQRIRHRAPFFQDEAMEAIRLATSATALSLKHIFQIRESWWRYHLMRWSNDPDPIIADMADRLLHRRLFKTLRILDDDDAEELIGMAKSTAATLGYDPDYYVQVVNTRESMADDPMRSLLVLRDNGSTSSLEDLDPLFRSLSHTSAARGWISIPKEVKEKMGRQR